MKNALDTSKLSAMVRTKRGSSGLRAAAAKLGNEVSPSTLSRIENGKVPDMETFLLLRGLAGGAACRVSPRSGWDLGTAKR